jgi:hypothetical protein
MIQKFVSLDSYSKAVSNYQIFSSMDIRLRENSSQCAGDCAKLNHALHNELEREAS